MAIDPTNSRVAYVGSANRVCKSTDAGLHFQCSILPVQSVQATITSLAVDPSQPSTVYASASVNGGVFKSTDGGQTWTDRSVGLPANGFIDSVTIDPFHPNVLFAWAGNGGYRSQDFANTWSRSVLPWPDGVSVGNGVRFAFDPAKPGIIYGPAYSENQFGVQKSIDGGQTWTALKLPFVSLNVVPDPSASGVLYWLTNLTFDSPSLVWKSMDGGATWKSYPFPADFTSRLSVDPFHSNILVAGGYRSLDGGVTWNPTNASRDIQAAFTASPGIAYAIAPITSDAFVAKFLPDGQTMVFCTYLGGMGDDSARAIALDNAGNIRVTGATSSFDFPVTSGAYQSTLRGAGNVFVAVLKSDGSLLTSTYLGGSAKDSPSGMAVDPQGHLWLIGSTTSADFPITTAPPPPLPTLLPPPAFLTELDESASHLLYSRYLTDSPKGIAIDPTGNVTIAGTTTDPRFPVTPGVFQSGTPGSVTSKAFVLKVDPSGQVIYSTRFGGSHGSPDEFASAEHEYGTAVAVDREGNAYVAGYTSATDFPASAGAYQTSLAAGCPYAAFSTNTGFIGTIFSVYVDDVFIVKLSPDGKTALYSTLLGGPCYDTPSSITVDAAGRAYVAGETDSINFPLAAPFSGAPPIRQFKSFLSVLSADGSRLPFSSYLYAGPAPSVVTGADGTIYVAGANGLRAQTQPDFTFLNPYPPVATDGLLAKLQMPAFAPALSLVEVSNGFSLLPGPVAPSEIVALKLPGFVPDQPADLGIAPASALSTTLSGVQVFFDGKPAYLLSVSAGQIFCIAPNRIADQTVVQVSANGALSNTLTVEVAPTALGLLSLDGSGTGAANARDEDGQLNSKDNPAATGSLVTVFFTGAGLTNPAEAEGALVSGADPIPLAKISVGFATSEIHALQGFVPGIFAATFRIPDGVASLSQLSVTVNSESSSSQPLRIFVK
jgi:uncharacterized protein (TIGR03437 family)